MASVRAVLLHAYKTWPFFELVVSDDPPCLIIVVSEKLSTSDGNIVLVLLEFGKVCTGTVMIVLLMSPSLNTIFVNWTVFTNVSSGTSISGIIF